MKLRRIDQNLLIDCQRLKEKIEAWQAKLEDKISLTKGKQDSLSSYRNHLYEKIDKFFDEYIERVNRRREALKEEYKLIEAREKRRQRSKQMKMEKDLQELKNFTQEFQDFMQEFDQEMDYLANRASYEDYCQDLLTLEEDSKKSTQFFKTSEYKEPKFQFLQTDLESTDFLGKIVDTSDFSIPLVAFNTYQLQAYCYHEKVRDLIQLKIVDENHLITGDVSRYFKSVYIPDDKFILLGGLERHTSHSSQRAFMIDEKGRLSTLQDMNTGRQYFATCFDNENEFVYVIAGYNHEKGILKSVEKFSVKARKWVQVEPINLGRINASATKCGSKYIYVFGGMDNRDFIDSIERFNLDLGIWTVLKVKLPVRMANHFAYSLNPEHIVIMGGMKRKNEEFVPKETKKSFELENRVFVLKTSNFKWKELKPFPFKKKLSNVVYNDYGKFFCFIIESNRELPHIFVYDVRSSFPQFDKYWESEKNQKEGLKKIKGKEIKFYLANLPQDQYDLKKYYSDISSITGSGVLNLTENDSILNQQLFQYTGHQTQYANPSGKNKIIELSSLSVNGNSSPLR